MNNKTRTHKERKKDLEGLRQRLGIGENTSYKDYLLKARGTTYEKALQRHREGRPPKSLFWSKGKPSNKNKNNFWVG